MTLLPYSGLAHCHAHRHPKLEYRHSHAATWSRRLSRGYEMMCEECKQEIESSQVEKARFNGILDATAKQAREYVKYGTWEETT